MENIKEIHRLLHVNGVGVASYCEREANASYVFSKSIYNLILILLIIPSEFVINWYLQKCKNVHWRYNNLPHNDFHGTALYPYIHFYRPSLHPSIRYCTYPLTLTVPHWMLLYRTLKFVYVLFIKFYWY